jgi:Zn-dependent protease with chaperone function
MERKKLYQLHPREYEHGFDRKALETLEETPGLERFARKFNKHAIERDSKLIFTGSTIKVTESNFTDIDRLLKEACANLHLTQIPDLYIQWGAQINAFTTGSENPIIVLNSGTVDLLSSEELLYVIGHEVGHIKSGHMLYHQMAMIIPHIGELFGSVAFGMAKVAIKGFRYPLIHWSRMSELSADRAGLLACQNNEAVLSTLMKMSGVPQKYFNQINTADFIKQAREFKDYDYNSLDRLDKILLILDEKHPWTVMRAAEILKWVESGKYQYILDQHSTRLLKEPSMCLNCGFELMETDKFCPGCGERIGRR